MAELRMEVAGFIRSGMRISEMLAKEARSDVCSKTPECQPEAGPKEPLRLVETAPAKASEKVAKAIAKPQAKATGKPKATPKVNPKAKPTAKPKAKPEATADPPPGGVADGKEDGMRACVEMEGQVIHGPYHQYRNADGSRDKGKEKYQADNDLALLRDVWNLRKEDGAEVAIAAMQELAKELNDAAKSHLCPGRVTQNDKSGAYAYVTIQGSDGAYITRITGPYRKLHYEDGTRDVELEEQLAAIDLRMLQEVWSAREKEGTEVLIAAMQEVATRLKDEKKAADFAALRSAALRRAALCT